MTRIQFDLDDDATENLLTAFGPPPVNHETPTTPVDWLTACIEAMCEAQIARVEKAKEERIDHSGALGDRRALMQEAAARSQRIKALREAAAEERAKAEAIETEAQTAVDQAIALAGVQADAIRSSDPAQADKINAAAAMRATADLARAQIEADRHRRQADGYDAEADAL